MRTIEVKNKGLRQQSIIVRILRFFAAAQNDGLWSRVIGSAAKESFAALRMTTFVLDSTILVGALA